MNKKEHIMAKIKITKEIEWVPSDIGHQKKDVSWCAYINLGKYLDISFCDASKQGLWARIKKEVRL